MPTQPNLAFSTATPADALTIRDLVRTAYARWVPIIGREPRPMLVDYALAVVSHRIDLLHDGVDLIGLIETDLREDHLWIENVAVDPARQGQGHGRRLLDHAETLANRAGRREMRLLTNAAFASNVALYQGIGFAETLREPFMGGTTLYMSKRLA